jgi:protein-disulfide isomerase
VPPTSRRSARQQRLANREANRNLTRAGTHGSGGSNRSFLLYTLAAIVVAVVVIGGALLLTQPAAKKPLTSPYPPLASVLTPSSIPTDGRTLGNANAPHTLNLYEDFQCTVCEAFTLTSEPQIVAKYVMTGKVKIVFHDFLTIDPADGSTTESLDAANAALCASDQGQFWPYHDWLFGNQYSENSGQFTKDRLKTIAQGVGIKDLTKFNTCLNDGSHNTDIKTAQTQIPTTFKGTPTLVIDNSAPLASFDFATVSAALDAAAGVTPSPSIGASGSVAPSASVAPSGSAAPSASIAPSAAPSALPS